MPICPKFENEKGMRRLKGCTRIGLATFAKLALCSLILLGACSTAPPLSVPVSHVVLMWLKDPESSADRAQLVRAAHSLQMIPGVLRVQTGRDVPAVPYRSQDFDLGVVITFRDRAAWRRYEKDPRNADTMRRYLQPLVRHYEIYNLSGR